MKKVNVAVKEPAFQLLSLVGKNCWSWFEQMTIFIGTWAHLSFNCVLFLWTPPIYKWPHICEIERWVWLAELRHWHQNFTPKMKENLAWWLHKVSVPCPRTYDQKWWCYLSSQRKNIMSELFPKHAAFLSRYFNHEPTNNSVLVNYNTLDRKWMCSRLKLLRTWISCGCHASSGCNGPRT